MRHEYDHEKRIKQDPVSATALAVAVVGAGSGYFASKQAEKASSSAAAAERKAREEAEAEARRVAGDTKPEDQSATIDFGGKKTDTGFGSTSDFLVKRESSTAGLGRTGSTSSGLGFRV